jgi:hypothetical protein
LLNEEIHIFIYKYYLDLTCLPFLLSVLSAKNSGPCNMNMKCTPSSSIKRLKLPGSTNIWLKNTTLFDVSSFCALIKLSWIERRYFIFYCNNCVLIQSASIANVDDLEHYRVNNKSPCMVTILIFKWRVIWISLRMQSSIPQQSTGFHLVCLIVVELKGQHTPGLAPTPSL